MDLVLHAPTAARLIGAPSHRLVVEVTDPQYGHSLHFCSGQIGVDDTHSVDVDRYRAVVSVWRNGDVADELAVDRAAFVAALAADRIGVLP